MTEALEPRRAPAELKERARAVALQNGHEPKNDWFWQRYDDNVAHDNCVKCHTSVSIDVAANDLKNPVRPCHYADFRSDHLDFVRRGFPSWYSGGMGWCAFNGMRDALAFKKPAGPATWKGDARKSVTHRQGGYWIKYTDPIKAAQEDYEKGYSLTEEFFGRKAVAMAGGAQQELRF